MPFEAWLASNWASDTHDGFRGDVPPRGMSPLLLRIGRAVEAGEHAIPSWGGPLKAKPGLSDESDGPGYGTP